MQKFDLQIKYLNCPAYTQDMNVITVLSEPLHYGCQVNHTQAIGQGVVYECYLHLICSKSIQSSQKKTHLKLNFRGFVITNMTYLG